MVVLYSSSLAFSGMSFLIHISTTTCRPPLTVTNLVISLMKFSLSSIWIPRGMSKLIGSIVVLSILILIASDSFFVAV